jgi:hypothetical protein
MNTSLRAELETRTLMCYNCDAEEPFVSNVTEEFLQQMDAFSAKHRTCQPKPFEVGELVEFAGIEGTVVSNDGDSGVVDIPGDGRVKWYWNFDGTSTRRVRRKK